MSACSDLCATSLEVVTTKTHKLIRLTTEVLADVASCAAILLEELIAMKLLSCESCIIATQPLVELRVRCYKCALELLNSICDVCLGEAIRIYCSKLCNKLLILV